MSDDLTPAFDRIEKLLEFPAHFPIKVMGRRHDAFASTIADLVREHVPGFDPASIGMTASSKGSFLSLTIEVTVESRDQLQALYQALSDHEMVRIVL